MCLLPHAWSMLEAGKFCGSKDGVLYVMKKPHVVDDRICRTKDEVSTRSSKYITIVQYYDGDEKSKRKTNIDSNPQYQRSLLTPRSSLCQVAFSD